MSSSPVFGAPRQRRLPLLSHLALVATSYLPVLLSAPGKVPADTKQYLYLDPGRLLARAPSMWDPNVGMGTVTHQTIGYLFPMAPYYWLTRALGVPAWVAQRLWLGTILFLAGAGVLFLLRTLAPRAHPAGPLVAALAYSLSPYSLDYAARISVILLPYAGLPWMVGLLARGLRTEAASPGEERAQSGRARLRAWRHPALFALVVAAVGGVNATALLYVGLAPALWLGFAVWVAREASPRQALATAFRTGVLTLAVSVWWMAGLGAQGSYGLPILKYSETVETVAKTSLASETLRGLGYWFFYGRDKLGPWISASIGYTQWIWLILTSFAIPGLAFLAALFTRWSCRAYFIGLILVGTAIAVGAHPYSHPSPLGAAFKAAATGSTAALAMRSTARAGPLVVLGLSVLLGTGVSALCAAGTRRSPLHHGAAAVAAGLAMALVAAANPALWRGELVDANLRRPEQVPSYWLDATRWLDQRGSGTRVLEIPGSDFAAYRWGNTVDPITPGLMDRRYVARELIPYGSPQSADLLGALDRRLQEGVAEPDAFAPMARLMGVGHIVYRADLEFERYNTPRPRPTWALLTSPPPPGLGPPVGFGPAQPNLPRRFPMLDEIALATPTGAPEPPPVSAFPVSRPRPIVRAEAGSHPVIVAGDGEGMVDLAAAGLLQGREPFFYAGSFAGRPSQLRVLAADADLVLTDTNRRRARRWSTVRENTGYTERPGEHPLRPDPQDARLAVFPAARDDSFTVVEHRGVQSVEATDYGNKISYTPEDRAANAFDGDPTTAWRTSAYGSPIGERLVIRLASDVTTDHVRLLQPITGSRNRFVTRATLRFDGGGPVSVALDQRSRQLPGQVVWLGPPRTFRNLEVTIDADNVGRRAEYVGFSPAGFAEVGIGDRRVQEVVRLPRDLLDTLGPTSASRRLTVVISRLRSAPARVRDDEERSIMRTFSLPSARSFTLNGTARIESGRPGSRIGDDGIDALLGTVSRASARSSARLPGSIEARASAAFDGDPSTFWQAPLGHPSGQWLEAELPVAETFDHLDLQMVADGRHSVPTRLRIETDRGNAVTLDVPAVADRAGDNAVVSVPLHFSPLTGRRVRVTIEAVREVRVLDYYSEQPVALPEAIAELGLPGVRTTRPAGPIPSPCRDDLLEVDGRAVPVRVVGDSTTAVTLRGLSVQSCAGPLHLAPGDHLVRARPGVDTGIDLDRLVLDSPPASPAPARATSARLTASTSDAEAKPRAPEANSVSPSAPRARVLHGGRSHLDVEIDGTASEPFWLVLGQSWNRGWTARIGGHPLGSPEVIDGYANGWRVQPEPGGRPTHVSLDWAPQSRIWAGLALSGLALLVCLALALPPTRQPIAALPDPPPSTSSPFAYEGPRPRAGGVALVVVAVLAVVSVVAGPIIGAIAAGAALLALLASRGRALLAIGAVAAVALAGALTAGGQLRNHYPPAFEWPTFFPRAHRAAWLGIALLATDALVVAVRTARSSSARRTEEHPPPAPSP